MIKLFASDMDGTLLNERHYISDETAAAVKRLQQSSAIEFMIATGRDYAAAQMLLAPHQIKCRIIALNGAIMYDENGKTESVYAMKKHTTRMMLDYLLKQTDVIVTLKSADYFYVTDYEAYKERLKQFIERIPSNDTHESDAQFIAHVSQLKSLESFNPEQEEALKMMVITADVQRLNTIKQYLAQFDNIDITSSNEDNIEITSIEAQKGLAIESYIHSKNITFDEVLTIGDSLNDRSMLKMAFYSYAMDNAPDNIKKIARFSAPSNAENGVATVIDQILSDSNIH